MIVLKSIDDPRDALERARLPELLKFAAANGVVIPREFHDKAIIVRRILRSKGLTRINVPLRVLGMPHAGQQIEPSEPVNTTDFADDLMRQVRAAPPAPEAPAPRPVKGVAEIAELRKECKRRGIKVARTDKLADLKAKLNGKQDTP